MGCPARFFVTLMALLLPILAHAEDTYFMASGLEHGKPVIFRSMTAVPDGVRESDLPYRVIIRWRYDSDLNGMPGPGSYNAQIALEDALVPLDVNDIGRQLVVVTGDNRKEWHWQVKEFDRWRAELTQRLMVGNDYPIEVSYTYEPEWKSFKAFLANLKKS